MTDYFIRKGEKPTLPQLVRVSDRKDGNVHFANAWGGFVYSVNDTAFADQFEQVPEATMGQLLKTFSPITVTALEGDGAMEGFTNGQRWNGWEVPVFSKETILEALSEGGHLSNPAISSNTRFLFDETSGDLYEITTEDIEFGEDFETAALQDFLTQPRTEDEVYAFGTSMGLEVCRAPRTAILVEGGSDPIVVYDVGNGWCWENAERFEASSTLDTIGGSPRR